jgi:5-deoxy-5-amino-3-dehydroquinate synthase
MNKVDVDLADRSYSVLVGPGVASELAAVLPPGVRRVAVVTQANIEFSVDPGVEFRRFDIGPGEEAKSLATIEDLCRQWTQWGLTRADAVVAVGGGMVTDVAGFAASVYHRGIPVIYVSTTLLGMIDAAVGGKTGVNLPEGKNLVGAFWQPIAVLCDTTALDSLPQREWMCGYGEMAKYHFLGAGDLRPLELSDQITRCVELKAEVVAEDEREGGRRAILNYGHTLAHAIEVAGDFDLRHGECVAIGLRYAAEVAHRLARIDSSRVREHEEVLSHYELSWRLPAGIAGDALVDLFNRDKKAVDGITFVLDGPDGVEPVRIDDTELLRDSLEVLR